MRSKRKDGSIRATKVLEEKLNAYIACCSQKQVLVAYHQAVSKKWLKQCKAVRMSGISCEGLMDDGSLQC